MPGSVGAVLRRTSATRRLVLPLLAIAAIAVTGCGSSNTPSAAGTPVWNTPSGDASSSADANSPSTQAGAASGTPSPSASKGSPSPSAATKGNTKYAFPIKGNTSYAHTHHDYPASDMMAACGTPVVAAVTGVVLEVDRVDDYNAKVNDGATRGGLSVSILGDDGVRYYGSHFGSINAGIEPGVRVTAGQAIALIGKSGDASACHMHFGISPPCARTGDWYNRRGLVYPWSYLDSWRAGGTKSPAAEVTAWQAKNGCPTKALVDP
jgi:peptidoglycan LD-endopeptidase LytH